MASMFRGFCPICGKQLLVEDEHPAIASCYCPEEHYSCKAQDFSRLWEEFDAQVGRLGLQKASTRYAEKLLKNLRSLNVAKRVKVR